MAIGKQYEKDDSFKKKARLHQAIYRANVLKGGFNEYGNRLIDGDAYLNYYLKSIIYRNKYQFYGNR